MSSGNNLNFKMGSLAKLIDNSQSKTIENGDILFGKYGPDANNPKAGSLYIQSNGTLLPVSLPPSSKKYMPLVGMGAGNPPDYSHIIALGDAQTPGVIKIYGGSSGEGYGEIRFRDAKELITPFYLPYNGNNNTYAVWYANGSIPVGSSTQPVYTNANGQVLACNDYAGGTALTLNGGSKAAGTASIYAPTTSGTNTYILKSNGENASPTWIQAVPVANGGTGKTQWTINRLIYASASNTLSTSSHYINGSKIAINSTSAPTENLYVNGSAKILGTTTLGDAYADTITLNGKVILVNNRTYGTLNPNNNTSLGTATTGQVYFKIIE